MAGTDGTRNRERTRRAVLDATIRVLLERGSGASLDTIAAAAGVSKSGLLHHFPSRDELLRAVAADVIERFRAQVQERVDLAESHPGKLLRAYVRTMFAEGDVQSELGSPALWTMLSLAPGVPDLIAEDSLWWREGFAADGLDEDRILLARYAADGFVAQARWDPALIPKAARHALELILALTESE